MELKSLSDACQLGHDVLVNATGFGSRKLRDVQDQGLEMIRGQTVVVKSNYDKLFMHDTGETYTYAIPRLDGTVVLGGTRHKDSVFLEESISIYQNTSQQTRRIIESLDTTSAFARLGRVASGLNQNFSMANM
ncbi:hypothetical protein N8T08_005624 [Aspergillus melleus]|uniref:Uncharacterized protein n=1 Tax=Aspergillus melleus TaxID=138277 RepID=A0ACC3B2Y0_9EURO|nr:hypothetical protein N8T08_005624 [Aspergillus melleus]